MTNPVSLEAWSQQNKGDRAVVVKESTRDRFDRQIRELGGQPAYDAWLGVSSKHRVLCAKGHERFPKPNSIQQGQGICSTCARTKILPLGPVEGTRLIVISEPRLHYRPKRDLFALGETQVQCVCICGKGPFWVRANAVRSGKSQSCGCLATERCAEVKRNRMHGTRQTYMWRKYLTDTCCVLCGKNENTVIDHHHGCGHEGAAACINCVRGILCNGCNRDVAAFDRWGWLSTLEWYRDRRPLLPSGVKNAVQS